jgi:transposase InsO family protein
MVSPSRRRDAVTYLCRRHPISERRACQLVGQHRSTQRYLPAPPELELALVKRMNELAARHPRYGYRRIWALLRAEGFEINHKRIERLWRLEGHRVPARKARNSGQKAVGSGAQASWNLVAAGPDDVWSYDFVASRTEDGAALRILNVVDEYTRRCVACRVDRSIGAGDLIEELEHAFKRHGKPRLLRSDNGREFIAASLAEWLGRHGVGQAFIENGRPQQNAFVERFNGTMRDEVLNGESFHSVLEARVVLGGWIVEYNTRRPHRGLGFKTPAAFYESLKAGSR